MDLSELLTPKKKNDTPLIQADVEPDKYQKIATTLCEKRRALEHKLEDAASLTKEDDAISLLQLKASMATFGISEIQYFAYIAQSTPQDVQKEQLQQNPQISTQTSEATSAEDEFRD
jgi:hypothetical protein